MAAAVAPPRRHGADIPVQRAEVPGPVVSPHPPGTLRRAAFHAAFNAEAG
jgi:hypothetical protein